MTHSTRSASWMTRIFNRYSNSDMKLQNHHKFLSYKVRIVNFYFICKAAHHNTSLP